MLLLFDISYAQIIDDYNLLALRTNGGFIKASQGIAPDPRFATHWAGTKKAGILRGAYHFWLSGLDPRQQARLFFDTLQKTGDFGELPPVLDIERSGNAKEVRACLEEIERLFNRTPLIYTSAYAWGDDRLKGDKNWASKYPLWVANYITNDLDPDQKGTELLKWREDFIDRHVKPYIKSDRPYLPLTWRKPGWKIWQVYQIGYGPDWGTRWPDSKQFDLDVFDGTTEQLLALDGSPADKIKEILDKTKREPSIPDKRKSVSVVSTLSKSGITPDIQLDVQDGDVDMQRMESLLAKLKKRGISPPVKVNVHLESIDMKELETLLATLKEAGIKPEVHIHLQEALGSDQSKTTTVGKKDKSGDTISQEITKSTPAPPDNSFTIEVKEVKTLLQRIKSKDKAGKPLFIPQEPRVILPKGTRLSVSTTHKESDKDSGDGTIHATGNVLYYYVTSYPSNSNPKGLFVKQKDVKRV